VVIGLKVGFVFAKLEAFTNNTNSSTIQL